MPSFRKVLVIRLSALGDVAIAIPQIYSLCQAYPETTFVMLTRHAGAGLFINAPSNLQTYIAEAEGRHKGISGLFLLYKELSKLEIDAVADLHDVVRTRILRLLFRLAGKPVFIIDKGHAGKRRLTSRHHKKLIPQKSSMQRYAEVFDKMAMPYRYHFGSLYPEGKGDTALFSQVVEPKADNEKWIGIAPFARHAGKIYPAELMENVIEQLSRQHKVRIFLFGTPTEANVLDKWEKQFPNVISLARDHLGFAVELALISHLDVMLSMDSANMHLAALVAVPVVSVWGATHPYAGFLGYTARPDLEVQSDLPCRPCSVFGKKPCFRGDYACLRGIAPQTIVQKIQSAIR